MASLIEGVEMQMTVAETIQLSPRTVIEPPPPRPDPRPEPVPDPLPEPEPEPPDLTAAPVRIEASDPASAAVLMQRAVGSFNAELHEDHGRWAVLIHPDRPREQLVLDAVELTEAWLAATGLPSATIDFDGRRHRIQP